MMIGAVTVQWVRGALEFAYAVTFDIKHPPISDFATFH